MWQIVADRMASGVPREGLLYFNFEDERLAGMAVGELQRVVDGGVYPVDPGLIPVFHRSGRANEGHALETAVALELERGGGGLRAHAGRLRSGFPRTLGGVPASNSSRSAPTSMRPSRMTGRCAAYWRPHGNAPRHVAPCRTDCGRRAAAFRRHPAAPPRGLAAANLIGRLGGITCAHHSREASGWGRGNNWRDANDVLPPETTIPNGPHPASLRTVSMTSISRCRVSCSRAGASTLLPA